MERSRCTMNRAKPPLSVSGSTCSEMASADIGAIGSSLSVPHARQAEDAQQYHDASKYNFISEGAL
jgi:hypothetical protein